MKNPWITKTSKKIYQNPWIELTEHQVVHPGGKDGIYGVVHFKNKAVAIIPLDEEYNTWLVGQYRYTLKQFSWEIPEGGSKLDIDPLLGAQRELKEETGITAKDWKEILNVDLSNSVTDETGVTYIAKDLSFGQAEPDEDEKLEIKKLPFSKVYEMAMSGEITDCLAVASIFKTQLLIEKGLI
ncbi:MAG: NUDIX hydrolase [Vicingaceae bacterium]